MSAPAPAPAAAWPLPRWVAHRGAGKLAPENTLAAFRLGASFGYRAFECDAKLSADAQPYLLHDAELDRTTDGRGPAGGLAWAELSRVDAGGWHSRAYAGEPVPALDAIVAYVRANGFALNVEIKPVPGTDEATGAGVADALARHWKAADAAPTLLLSSFRVAALAAARGVAPHLPRALLLDAPWAGWQDAAASLGCVAVIPNHRLIDEALVAEVRGRGWRLATYTVNDAADAARLLALGVDSLITDAVDRFAPAG